MKLRVIKARELSRSECARWSQIQDSDPELASPYFRPEFSQAVGRVRDDAYIGIMEDAGQIVGFFPYQLCGPRVGKPIGWPLSDYQGVIAEAGTACDPAALLSGCGLDAFDFDHMLASQRCFAKFHRSLADSPYLDLRQGYEHYAADRERAGSKVVNARMATKWRKLEREAGPLRYAVQDDAEAAFQALLSWKSDQYRRTNAVDLFSYDWPVALLRELRGLQGEGFACLLSSLYAGDQLVAVHLGLRSRSVWHYWFPAYATEFHKYSAGYRLIIEMAQSAPDLGIVAIDLGRGDVSYKQRLGSASIPVAKGFIARPSLAMARRVLWQALGSWIERLPAAFAWDLPRRAYRRIEARNRVP